MASFAREAAMRLLHGRAEAPRRETTPRRLGPNGVIFWVVPGSQLSLIEFPADDPARARRFWAELLGVELEAREAGEGEGWQTRSGAPAVGVHARGAGPGDSFSLPYFTVSDIDEAVERVKALGGSVVHPGEAWAICKDSEGSPFGLARAF
jgi:predicted enzyme related to lactoylglutathione lyase